jgi:hypothetical protein
MARANRGRLVHAFVWKPLILFSSVDRSDLRYFSERGFTGMLPSTFLLLLSTLFATIIQVPVRESYHHGDLRAALLRAALDLMREQGDHEFTLREVARRVGVSHAAPVRHFRDKDALLAAIAEEGFIRFTAS